MTKKLHFLNGENIQNKNGIDKREAEAKMREESLERSREAAEEQKQVREYYYKKELSIESIYSSFAGVNLRVQ